MRNPKTVFTVGAACLALFTLATTENSAQTPQTFQGSNIEEFLSRAKITGIKDIGLGVTLPVKATLEDDRRICEDKAARSRHRVGISRQLED